MTTGYVSFTHFEITPTGWDPLACYQNCVPAAPVFEDTFARYLTGEFGTADTGQTWVCTGETADIVVPGGYAQVLVSTDPLIAYSGSYQTMAVVVGEGCAVEADFTMVGYGTQDWWITLTAGTGDMQTSVAVTQSGGVLSPVGIDPMSSFTLRIARHGGNTTTSVIQYGVTLASTSISSMSLDWSQFKLSEEVADFSGTDPGSITAAVSSVRVLCGGGCTSVVPS